MKVKFSIAVVIAIAFFSCKDESKETTSSAADMQMHADSAAVNKIDFSKITFASKKDTTCHMPLSAGVQDTAVVDGKVYGFCSKECKDEFLKTLQAKK